MMLMHRLGLHGPNWHPFWLHGNVWIECHVCGARRMLSFDNASEIPGHLIASGPKFGNSAATGSALTPGGQKVESHMPYDEFAKNNP